MSSVLLLAAALAFAQEAPVDPVPTLTASATEAAVVVIWPRPGEGSPFVERSFTFGTVTPGSTFTINGLTAAVSADGVFFEMVPFSTGAFTLDYRAEWQGQTASSQVVVSVSAKVAPPIDGSFHAVEPAANLEVRSGDLIIVRCEGPAGETGVFRINGLSSKLPMPENPAKPGSYEGHYWVQPGDRGAELKVTCGLKRGFFGGPTAEAAGKISVLDPSQTRTGVTKSKVTVLKTLEGGYTSFWSKGVKLEISGRSGNLYKVRLSEHEAGWVEVDKVELLPEGTPPPRGRIGRYLNTMPEEDAVALSVDVSEALPFEVRQTVEPLGFTVRFFGAEQRFDRIRFDPADAIFKDVRWRQESSRVTTMEVDTRLAWGWGYSAGYEKGNFVLRVKRPPNLAGTAVLAGRRIVVDAGHGPQLSAVGPRGASERDANMAISRELETMLRAEGADVYMIRVSSDGPSLVDRAFLAAEAGGDLYISVHNNAFPVDADPFERPRGYMTFYYHPQSRALAEAVHGSYVKRQTELADEAVRWGDLYVCRMTEMPSILTESAYIILPDHEKRLLDAEYRKSLAKTMLDGLKSYYEAYREIQKASPAEQRAAQGL